jgi:hypothetical protein
VAHGAGRHLGLDRDGTPACVCEEAYMSTNQILIGVGLIFVLAVGSQVLASRLNVPALIVLLPAGFAAAALTSDVNPVKLLGPAFQPGVSVAVAVILYDSGLGLDPRNLRGHARKVVIRLLVFSFAFTGVSAPALLGLSARATPWSFSARRNLQGPSAQTGLIARHERLNTDLVRAARLLIRSVDPRVGHVQKCF